MIKKVNKIWKSTLNDGIETTFRKVMRGRDIEGRAARYRKWASAYGDLNEIELPKAHERIGRFSSQPLISIVMPVYNVDERYLRQAIDSIRNQIYENWELCIADDQSTAAHIRPAIEVYLKKDLRIRAVFREENGHISAASNSALALASGEFTALMDNDDILTRDALFQVVKLLNEHPDTQLIYSDEDKIDANGKVFFPMFKPGWSPEFFRSLNLLTHLCVYRTARLREIGGFREGYEGSQDYDLALRYIETIDTNQIRHIPHVLYHWRAIPGSVALGSEEKSYAHQRARKALDEHFKRCGIPASSVKGVDEIHRTLYEEPPETTASIVVGPSCVSNGLIEYLANSASTSRLEVIVCNAEAHPKEQDFAYIGIDAPEKSRFQLLNDAAAMATGDVIVFVDGSTIEVSKEWLTELLGRACLSGVGAVGVKIVDRRARIIHAGYFLGIKEGVGRAHHRYPAKDVGEFIRLAVDQNFSAVSARFMAIRREVFESVNGFCDSDFPQNYADIDLCLRLKEMGYRTAWTPWVEAVQTRDDNLPINPELERLRDKWKDAFENDPYYNPNLTTSDEDLSLAFPPRTNRI